VDKACITIIGAGAVGLAIAAEVSAARGGVFVVEKHETFGRETSSRSSEVIHAGIYYPAGTLKARLCVEGNRRIYDICRKSGVAHSNIGKLVVAVGEKEAADLEGLLAAGKAAGAEGVRIISSDEARALEPNVRCDAALYCPTSGIVDSHGLMKYFEGAAKSRGAEFAYGCEATDVEKISSGFRVGVLDADGGRFDFETEILVNAAGLHSPRVAAMAGVDVEKAGYKLNYFKGVFFRLKASKAKLAKMLVYPVPPFPGHVGVHTVPDLAGQMKIGPLSMFVKEINYDVDATLRREMYDSVKKFLPFVEEHDLEPDSAGIQPKLEREGGGTVLDFIIRHEADRGLPMLINLVGIDSPGLTSSPAIGMYVADIIKGIL
jgi:L-2-hydroxyglutarate oxidase LhgO